MPKATVEGIEPKRFDLKSAPPDGFVLIRVMPWGEKMKRQGMATQQSINMQQNGPQTDTKMFIDITQQRVAEWEFANLIIDHNLEDANGVKLDFRRPETLNRLDPRIGDEINTYIAEMNNFESGEGGQQGNSSTDSKQQSSSSAPTN